MKIGILTFSSAFNFGAVLQCYGLYDTLCSLGHDVRIIDYRPKYLKTYKPTFGIRQFINWRLWLLPSKWRTYRYWRKRYDLYDRFECHEMRLTSLCSTNDDIRNVVRDLDYVVVGSDQVWNSRFNGMDEAWYGTLKSGHEKWITYAASVGKSEVNPAEVETIMKALDNFDAISVREDTLKETIEKKIKGDVKISTVLDPSLLVLPDVWVIWWYAVVMGDYNLTYQARECDDVFRVARELSKQMNGAKIIPVDFFDNVKKNQLETMVVGPKGFISLVKNARCVVTTSFHGTAFSIINKTPFYTLRLDDGADDRVENLLHYLKLDGRLIAKDSHPELEPVDFQKSHSILDELREQSLKYLKSALQ